MAAVGLIWPYTLWRAAIFSVIQQDSTSPFTSIEEASRIFTEDRALASAGRSLKFLNVNVKQVKRDGHSLMSRNPPPSMPLAGRTNWEPWIWFLPTILSGWSRYILASRFFVVFGYLWEIHSYALVSCSSTQSGSLQPFHLKWHPTLSHHDSLSPQEQL